MSTALTPCLLISAWHTPSGRPVLSQGDVAVGRTCRDDVASVLVAVLAEPAASGKTFEFSSVQVGVGVKSRSEWKQRLLTLGS